LIEKACEAALLARRDGLMSNPSDSRGRVEKSVTCLVHQQKILNLAMIVECI
jgi:hypothetical protein